VQLDVENEIGLAIRAQLKFTEAIRFRLLQDRVAAHQHDATE
jgi:hypothetical protein